MHQKELREPRTCAPSDWGPDNPGASGLVCVCCPPNIRLRRTSLTHYKLPEKAAECLSAGSTVSWRSCAKYVGTEGSAIMQNSSQNILGEGEDPWPLPVNAFHNTLIILKKHDFLCLQSLLLCLEYLSSIVVLHCYSVYLY